MISRSDIIHLMVRCGPFVTKANEYNVDAFLALVNAAVELESKQ